MPTTGAIVVVSNGNAWRVEAGASKLGASTSLNSSPAVDAAAVADTGTLLYVASDDGQSIVVSTSSDDGASWQQLESKKLDGTSIGGLSIASVDGSTVAVLVTIEGGSASSIGITYVHSDAGWKNAPAPAGGLIAAGAGRYWLVDGAAGDHVFVSADGLDWHSTKLPETTGDWTAGLPTEVSDKSLVIPVLSHADGVDSDLTFYGSADDGSTWAARANTTTPPTEIGTSGAVSITSSGPWIAAFADGSKIRTGDLAGAPVRTLSPNGLAPNVSAIAFSTQDFGVAWSTPSVCPNGKASCTTSGVISTSNDGGQTWAALGQ